MLPLHLFDPTDTEAVEELYVPLARSAALVRIYLEGVVLPDTTAHQPAKLSANGQVRVMLMLRVRVRVRVRARARVRALTYLSANGQVRVMLMLRLRVRLRLRLRLRLRVWG